uniref:Endonuclease/exonuclease/phosphatase domain-containing protein n=1 Tax=Spongospora subterranea TaxID=70186 RepID=A0A0H5RAG0_9EUKA|eukprot:CRZ05424.1 hypothetical protein [Spongospora subterranea]
MSHYEIAKMIEQTMEVGNKNAEISDDKASRNTELTTTQKASTEKLEQKSITAKSTNDIKIHTRQMKITRYLKRVKMKNKTIRTTRRLNIAQWNACSLNEQKAQELRMFANINRVDVICISELNHRRQIDDFPNHESDDRYT